MLNISFNDFELEFLRLFDIELKDDFFVNIVTGDKFTYSDYQDNTNLNNKKYKYIFTSHRGDSIEFKREKGERKNTILTVDYIYNDYHHWAEEDFDIEHNLINERTVGMDNVVKYDPSNPVSKKIAKDESNISAKGLNYSDYFFATVFAYYKDFYSTIDITEMTCSLSNIYPNAVHRYQYKPFELDDVIESDPKISLSRENYILALTTAINNKYKNNNSMRLFYLRMIPFLLKVFESSLQVPYKYRDVYIYRLENRKKALKKAYSGTKLIQKLNEVDEMYNYLYNYFPSLDLNNKELLKD